jgi:hypothetical protein
VFKTFYGFAVSSQFGFVERIDITAVIEFFDEAIVDKVFRFGALGFGVFF